MRPEQQKLDDLMGNFVGLALTLIFVLILFVLSTKPYNSTSVPSEESPVAVAQVVPTATSGATVEETTEISTEPATQVPTIAPTETTAPSPTPAMVETSTASAQTDQPMTTQADHSSFDPVVLAHGKTLYATCAGCHGMDALGVPNLGKNLVGTEFMRTHSDQELVQFIITGRPLWDPENTTGIDMPSRGGNPMLADDDILSIIIYLRSLDSEVGNSSSANEETSQTSSDDDASSTNADTSTSEDVSADQEASSFDPAVLAHGETLYATCAGCHGMDALGVPNLGKNLVGTEFMRTHSDQDLLQFIISGRPLWDPANTTGIDMPSRGGNPMLTDDDIVAIIIYLRSLDSGAGG